MSGLVAKQYYWPGKPNGYQNLQLREIPVPNPGPGEVLVKIHAMSLNFRELLIARNAYPFPVADGIAPGADPVGSVVSVGQGVTQWAPGDRVVPNFLLDDDGTGLRPELLSSAMGAERSGSLVEYYVFPSKALLRIPDHLTYEQAATLPGAGITAWSALHGGPAPLRVGQTIVLQGTGGVSIIAAQIAVATGARVIITSSSDEKLALAKTLGVHDTINYKDTPDWAQEVKRLTGNRGADLVVDVGGTSTIAASLEALAFGGQVAIVGLLGGVEMPSDALVSVIRKNAIMRGITIGDIRDFRQLLGLVDLHKINPVVGRVFEFEQAKEAFACLERQDFVGKVVVKVSKV